MGECDPMKKLVWLSVVMGIFSVGLLGNVQASTPEQDLQEYRELFKQKFPRLALNDFADGVYAIDSAMRENWMQIEEFAPYEFYIEEGKQLFEKPFANGKGYADCFANGGIGIAQNYPYWDRELGEVMTLAWAVNRCREANGEQPLKYKKGKLASILAYMTDTSRGKQINVVVPKDDPRALAAYEEGKKFFFARRGQLNFACSHCHIDAAGQLIRTNRLSPAMGQVTNFPVYRSKWGELGTLHRRYDGCNKQVRAKPFPAQGREYRNLEYFHVHMSNGIPLNGPGSRQ